MPRRNKRQRDRSRRHTNNHAYTRIKSGRLVKELKELAKELGIPYGRPSKTT
jgi:hypothetical protein